MKGFISTIFVSIFRYQGCLPGSCWVRDSCLQQGYGDTYEVYHRAQKPPEILPPQAICCCWGLWDGFQAQEAEDHGQIWKHEKAGKTIWIYFSFVYPITFDTSIESYRTFCKFWNRSIISDISIENYRTFCYFLESFNTFRYFYRKLSNVRDYWT